MDLTSLIILSFLLLITISNLPWITSAGCSISKCPGPRNPDIRFPFWIRGSKQSRSSCGYPGFEVFCDGSKETLIELPSYGRFSVKSIDYAAQELWVNDPNNCLPKRMLTLNLSRSPFSGVYLQDFSFFNCSQNIFSQNAPLGKDLNLIGPIPCLSGSHYFVFGTPTNSSKGDPSNGNTSTMLLSSLKCFPIGDTIKVPVQWPVSLLNQTEPNSLNEDLRLTWFMPECRSCELNGQMCGLNITKTSFGGSPNIACWNIPNSGGSTKLPLTTYIAVLLVLCLPSIVCLSATLIIWIRARMRSSPIPEPAPHAPAPATRPNNLSELGLMEAGVQFAREVVRLGLNGEFGPESQPKIVEGEIEEAGPIEESMCSICMSEYQPKDKIGTLQMCGHHFHADCIHKWFETRRLALDKTCPICRARHRP